MSTLYDADIVLWSEQQADKLRRIARGEQPNEVDWENIVEEIESVGRSELKSVASLLRHALEHFLKAAAWPDAPSARKWVNEAYSFLDDAEDGWAPSMAQRIDLAQLYRRALDSVRRLDMDEGVPGPLPATCPVALDDLLRGGREADLAPRFRQPA